MATTIPTYAQNASPKGDVLQLTKTDSVGVVTIPGGGTYVTNGLPLTFASSDLPYANPVPIWGWLQTFAALTGYVWDNTHNTIRIFASGTELTNGASVSADTVQARFTFDRDL